jgi:hypothetical protein
MKTINSLEAQECDETNSFNTIASKRHINMENLRKLAYIINESEFSNKERKMKWNRQSRKNTKTSQTLANSGKKRDKVRFFKRMCRCLADNRTNGND